MNSHDHWEMSKCMKQPSCPMQITAGATTGTIGAGVTTDSTGSDVAICQGNLNTNCNCQVLLPRGYWTSSASYLPVKY